MKKSKVGYRKCRDQRHLISIPKSEFDINPDTGKIYERCRVCRSTRSQTRNRKCRSKEHNVVLPLSEFDISFETGKHYERCKSCRSKRGHNQKGRNKSNIFAKVDMKKVSAAYERIVMVKKNKIMPKIQIGEF